MTPIPTPEVATWTKTAASLSDTYIQGGVYKFLGCTILNVSCSLGFNGTASSLSVTLVQDTANGDAFIAPTIPSLAAFSLPAGGQNIPIFYPDSTSLQPNGFNPTNTPFFFVGIITHYSINNIDISGQTITVSIEDARSILTGCQILLGGFALSQNIGGASPRYDNVKNVIDVFGYFTYGMDSERNKYGIPWYNVLTALQAVKVTLEGLSFEFYFTGDTFNNVPTFYRIDENIIDIVGLAHKVADDSGSDFIIIARKMSATQCVVEFRGIKRTNGNPLTIGEINTFIAQRGDIVENAKVGREWRNEPTSSIVLGGMQNANYTAFPTSYNPEMHLSLDSVSSTYKEDYNVFPPDIKTRIFGGSGLTYVLTGSSGITPTSGSFNVKSGAIFPFWGFTPDDHAYPMIEPFISLDHLVFDKTSSVDASLKTRLPQIKIALKSFNVRVVPHQDVFLAGDGGSDSRPFAYISDVISSIDETTTTGYLRGLPLNTEVLRAALIGPEAFFCMYHIHYPDIADYMGLQRPDFSYLLQYALKTTNPDITPFWRAAGIQRYRNDIGFNIFPPPTPNVIGAIPTSYYSTLNAKTKENLILQKYHDVIYEQVKQYADTNLGKRFLICLPASPIMQRIWVGLPVPTNPNLPEIEYIVDNRGYWNNLPPELGGPSGTNPGNFVTDEVNQITRKFMAEDGRFYPMVGIDWKPSGNMSFNSNTNNRVMFQDLPVSEFRPNRIASANPSYILSSCTVNQLSKRPDLALLELPGNGLQFEPVDGVLQMYRLNNRDIQTYVASKVGIIKYLWYIYSRDSDLRNAIDRSRGTSTQDDYAIRTFNIWADEMMAANIFNANQLEMSTERLMDLKGVIIPLTSTWVSYGPYYYNYNHATGMANIIVDDNLVPWNFPRASGVMFAASGALANLNAAGQERVARTLAIVDYVDNASITCAGFPEYGLGSYLGYNSNITGISIDFGIGGIKTVYSLATYNKKPGTYRKDEYDNVAKGRVDLREKLPDPVNNNLVYDVEGRGFFGVNQFQD